MDLKFILDDISNKIGELIENGPTKDIKNNVKLLLNSVFSKLNVITKEEFELQQNIILDLNNKINNLEEKIEKINVILDNKNDN